MAFSFARRPGIGPKHASVARQPVFVLFQSIHAHLIAAIVPLAREIDPFWMTKLVSHKAQVPLSSKYEREHPEHLVQNYSSLNAWGEPSLMHASELLVRYYYNP